MPTNAPAPWEVSPGVSAPSDVPVSDNPAPWEQGGGSPVPPTDWGSYVKQVAKGTAEGANTIMGAEIGSAFVPPIGTAVGAAAGYGLSKVAEWLTGEGDLPTKGQLAQTAMLGPMSEDAPAASMILRFLKSGAMAGAQFTASDMAKQAIDNGTVDNLAALRSAAGPASISALLGASGQGTPAPVSDAMRGKIAAAQMGREELGTAVAPSASGNTNPLIAVAERFAGPVDLQRSISASNTGKVMDAFRNTLQVPAGEPITAQGIDDFQKGVIASAYKPVINSGAVLTDPQLFQDFDNAVAQFGGKNFPNQPGNGLAESIAPVKYSVPPSPQNPQGVLNPSIDAGTAITQIQDWRDAAKDAFKSGTAQDAKLGHGYRALADGLEDQVGRNLMRQGPNGQQLLTNFQAGRVRLSQANLIDSSMDWGPDGIGTVNPVKLGNVFQQQQGKGLTDGLGAAGAMANLQSKYMQNTSKMVPPGREGLATVLGSLGGLAYGAHAGNMFEGAASGAALSGIAYPAAKGAVRKFLGSDFAQNNFANADPSGLLPQPLAAQGIRASLILKAQQDNNAPPGLSQYIAAAQTAGEQ